MAAKELAIVGSVDAWDMNNWGTLKGITIPLNTSKNTPQPQAGTEVLNNWSNGFLGYNSIIPINYDGEKDLGEMGLIRKYIINHSALRLRSWQLYLDSDVCQALFGRSTMWSIGTGLRLQSKPAKGVLRKKGVSIDSEKFNDQVEEMFKVFASNPICDYEGKRNLHSIAWDGWLNSRVGGDVLVVLRIIDGMPKVQLIDGANVKTPLTGATSSGQDVLNPDNNYIIRNGIEEDKSGKPVAYWVQKVVNYTVLTDFERIPVMMDKFPYCQMACMVYGLKYRLNNNRGIPLIAAVMETASKMGRYREATLGSAEEGAKIILAIEHERGTGDENPMLAQMAGAYGAFSLNNDLPADSYGNNLSNKVQATTNKQTVNLPEGAKLNPFDSKKELNFKDFYSANFDIVCAVAGYPPEVILSKYDSNYSASRAAIKDFEHTLLVQREAFANQFYQIIYNFCLDFWVLNGDIQADGYREMLFKRDALGLTAYRNAYWMGDNVPHIDPEKEVRAWRLKLGEDSANVPLCTVEEATEALSGGDAISNIEQYVKEFEFAQGLGIEKVLPKGATVEPGEATKPTTPKKKDKKTTAKTTFFTAENIINGTI